MAGGLPDDKLLRVEGLASSRLLHPEQPNDPTNRRISIVVLTQEAEQRLLPSGAAMPALQNADELSKLIPEAPR